MTIMIKSKKTGGKWRSIKSRIGKGDYPTIKDILQSKNVKQELDEMKKQKGTQFGILTPQGLTHAMTIDINKIKSQDPLESSYGFFYWFF